MNYRIYEHRSRSKTILILLILMAIFISGSRTVLGVVSGGKCTSCHTSDIKIVKAVDTVPLNDTCFKCHDPRHTLEHKGLDIHGIHDGKSISRSDYLERHPKVESEDCGKCHIGTSKCMNCHEKNMPHAASRLDCTACHGEITSLFKHAEIKLDKHDFFKNANQTACTTCHDSNKDYLVLLNRAVVPISEPHRLCYQCHSNIYREWISGMHFANKTAAATKYYEDPSLVVNWMNDNTCTRCHDAHATEKMLWVPPMAAPTPEKVVNTGSFTNPLTHIAIILAFSLAVVVAYMINLKVKVKIKR